MIELKKICAWTADNPRNFDTNQIIKIFLVPHNAYLIFKDPDKFVFYVVNNIDWDLFNQLYNFNQQAKDISNVDTVVHKLRLVLTRATNNRLEVTRKKRRKREEIMERQKAEAMAEHQRKTKEEISSFCEEDNKL